MREKDAGKSTVKVGNEYIQFRNSELFAIT